MSHKRPVPCGCAGCELPFAYIQNGVLVIESRHHGEQHVNVLALAQVIELLQRTPPAVYEPMIAAARWLLTENE